jgi:WD40 repeat protein
MTSDWKYKKISGSLHPRQFEYHPSSNDLLFGTIGGYVFNVDLVSDSIRNLGKYGVNNLDSILGLCWLKNSSSKFIVGSSMGQIACGDTRSGFNGLIPTRPPSIIKEYPAFDKLTCICVNSTNDYILASGYSCDARIYDLETGLVQQEYKDAHMSHINISRFANHSPKLFTTSSFDGSAKSWDLRMNTDQPIYTMNCQSSIVMISYSPDDTFILSSALDNEISQFLTVDGRKHTSFQVPKTGLESNFTRYLNFYSVDIKCYMMVSILLQHIITAIHQLLHVLCLYFDSFHKNYDSYRCDIVLSYLLFI